MANGTRTRDHRDHNPGLYQLSYRHREARTIVPARARGGGLAGYEAVCLGVHGRGVALLVAALAELLDHLLVERRDVVRLAARDDAVVDDDLLVDPVAAGVVDVGLEGRPGGERAAAHRAGLDEHPRAVADHGERLLRLDELADEVDRVLVAAQLVGVADAARDQQRVVVADRHFLDGLVDLDLVGRVEMVEPLDLAVVDRDDLGLRAGVLERLARLLQLDPLEHVGREDRDLLALQLLLRHSIPPVSLSSRIPRRARSETGGTLNRRARSSGDRAADF